jgi:cysteine sulfinate desulfinase/cysteine desulfurase-like protein
MGVPRDDAGTAIRVSLGRESAARAVERFLEAWGRLARRYDAAAASPAA